MTDKLITKKAVSAVLNDYWDQAKASPIKALISLIFPGIGNIFVFYIPPLIIAKLVDMYIASEVVSLGSVAFYIALFTVGWLLGEVLWRLGIHFLIAIEANGINKLSKKSFNLLTTRDYEFFADNFVGSLAKKASAYSRNFEGVFDTLAFNVVSEIIPLVFVFIILSRYSFWLPLILVICLSILIVIAIPIIKKRTKLVAERHDANSVMVGRLSDSLTNMLAIKSFAKEKQESKIFGKQVDIFIDKFKNAANYQNLRYDTIVSPFYVFTNSVGLVAAIFLAQNTGLPASAIVVVFSYYAQITRIFWNISRVYRNTEYLISEAAEFAQMFVDKPKISNDPNAKKLKVKDGKVGFHNVNFKYCTDDKNCFLNNFNLDIEKQQKVGLVGPSGGGKTTITKLLLRFADPNSGDITIDGQIIKNVTQESLREAISYVPQEPLLFHRSLFENIAYGDEKATKKEVIRAAKIAHADEFIRQLPEGYDTLVGERGIKLSGGQRQRVAIARALLKKSPILVLDEATSSLDSESEKYIQEGLWELMKNRTALVIAHRLSTIKHLDRILVLDDGVIVEDGTHKELLKLNGLYAKLWDHQTSDAKNSKKEI